MYRIAPGCRLTGDIRVPGDKSISHRALMFGAIARGTTDVRNLLESEDCLATLNALLALGANIEKLGVGHYRIVGVEHLVSAGKPIDCGNSGTGMRLLSGLIVGQGISATLVGDDSLMGRPMKRISEPLRAQGAVVRTADNGCPPVIIEAGAVLRASTHELAVASAQVKSAILLAGLGAAGATRVSEPAHSRDHTERMLQGFGVELAVDGLTVEVVGPQTLSACDVTVPADPSSAAFFAVAAALAPGSDITLLKVGMNPTRSGFVDVLERMGARIERLNASTVGGEPVCDLRVRSGPLTNIDVPPNWVARTIDEFPVLFVAAAMAKGVMRVRGARELRVKETDRLAVTAAGLETLGVQCELYDDGIDVHGGALKGGHVHSGGDHRIAMAFAAAGTVAADVVTVEDTANVATSFPNFAALACSAGWQVDHVGD
ncbi:MAG: 3-phosphoshikimate 1-carboxyvinyltransferase [Gammaproteobacteria bacterium]